jgi:hypothetical protein
MSEAARQDRDVSLRVEKVIAPGTPTNRHL